MTLNEMIRETKEKAKALAAENGYNNGAGKSFETSHGTVIVNLEVRQSRTLSRSSRVDHFAKTFKLNGKRIARAKLEAIMN